MRKVCAAILVFAMSAGAVLAGEKMNWNTGSPHENLPAKTITMIGIYDTGDVNAYNIHVHFNIWNSYDENVYSSTQSKVDYSGGAQATSGAMASGHTYTCRMTLTWTDGNNNPQSLDSVDRFVTID